MNTFAHTALRILNVRWKFVESDAICFEEEGQSVWRLVALYWVVGMYFYLKMFWLPENCRNFWGENQTLRQNKKCNEKILEVPFGNKTAIFKREVAHLINLTLKLVKYFSTCFEDLNVWQFSNFW